MKSARRSDVDTISNLPCNVVDEILGCLPLKDAVKTSILSKDWRYKWVTRQELDFGYNFFGSFAHDQEAKTIIYQVLLIHKGPILKFKLGGFNLKSCPDIDHWILFLSKKNIQEFTLHIWSGNIYHLPSHLFTFQQLRRLEIHKCLFYPPSGFKGFEKLINLDFDRVTFVPSIFRNLISKCPLLERLRLLWCTDFDTLEIVAPNLKFFEFRGKSKSFCFKNAPVLSKVILSLNSPVLADASPVCSNFMKFFHCMPSLRELDIRGWLLEYLTKGGLPENPPTALNNVKTLKTDMSFRNVEEVSVAVYLITSCPKLQQLTIRCQSVDNDVEPVVHFLRAQSFSGGGVVKLLQRVHMSTFSGLEMEMEFVRFILASAPLLKQIFIWNYSCFLLRPGRQLMNEIKQYRRASPDVEFKFEEVDVDDLV
ncbi:F-box/FBD/LRR-repeat protein At1g13570-like isoform X1 [Nicotiana tomentosiformis]|uniref:F-box/FBD/LRR-repeat protein At1g13570-like isoform X1 n=1 Tax=Nicotiana tomentosiformis TaxID=4098 RepID=UPI00051C6826|nr:F-box/FBD/LRR-repeat protein At1g13570-like isoform X1 [Nicotiana tomentosiformis]XP_009594959.1 F-box/FBD/LRR-repeat protein At1g13570-like isoform X1 [Nicotiana tomentosiformis]XP_009594960.1 F-box/FBD/LRR-repeat protein At1g13570-like isoform X1 [Nicotiana tomentosiformis]XP_018624706.1 F-box/FBD/LRR-repeat protein At1g13570-like isoform X1 [Nicotiana tomentosiformis]XP_033510739.1 F-box/FBD/LRR-repeat protein At1g13570-like isoform X1 [Nicotiana tomentosiformis]XP_033510740.1 F-box/FBD/